MDTVKTRTKTLKINVMAPYISADGYGQAASNLLLSLDKLPGVDLFPIHIHPKYTNENFLEKRVLELCRRKVERGDIIILFLPPMADLGPKYPGQKVVNFTMFETTKIPIFWPSRMNRCDEIWTPSQWGKEVMVDCGVTAPVEVQNLGIPNWRCEFANRKNTKGPFVFGWQANNGNDNRKGARMLIRAFQELFGRNSGVELWLKSRLSIRFPLPPENNIVFFVGENNNQEMHRFFKRVNCFVFPSRGEGWGLPPMEAMATGCPTILTNWSSMTEFMDESYCYPLKVARLEKIDCTRDYPSNYFGPDVGEWALPDYEDLKRLMKHVYENYEEALDKGFLAHQTIKEKWAWDTIAKQVVNKVERILNN